MATILITGSNSGFGRLAALTLARGGHDVIATMRTPSKGEDLQRLADDEGLSIEIRHLDVTDPASVEGCLADPHEIDVLVNNAGFEVEGAIEQIDDSLMWLLGEASPDKWGRLHSASIAEDCPELARLDSLTRGTLQTGSAQPVQCGVGRRSRVSVSM